MCYVLNMAKENNESLMAKKLTGESNATLAVPEKEKLRSARGPPFTIPIIAIGASAGGLEAASKLIDNLSEKSGASFILVQHLDPTHKSLMVELLAEHTAMKVVEAVDGAILEPNQIHVIPPGRYLYVRSSAIHLSPHQANHGARLPFDYLLASLAESYGSQTIGVVLSGTGADGSKGIATLKASGGYVFAQDPEEAEYSGMPASAISTGQVDQILTLSEIAKALAERTKHASISRIDQPPVAAAEAVGLDAIINYLNDTTSHDFRQYKAGTLERRIERRIALLGLKRSDQQAYLNLLHEKPAERNLLATDLLINVTSFFRDPQIFEALSSTIIPELVKDLAENRSLRVWVAGCSTGEEAYSIAMICHEAIEQSGRDIKLQVFASDVDPVAIEIAREGLYPFTIASDVSAKRLGRFFIEDDAGYRVSTKLRSDVVFTVQDVLTDPPFSKIDLVSCRNLLIYLNPEAQAKVVALFHFALREGGILVLGSAETIGGAADRFETISKSKRFYRHIVRSRIGDPGFPLSFGNALPVLDSAGVIAPLNQKETLAEICHAAVLAINTPAAVLINRDRQCLFSMGPIDRYLRIAAGNATLDLLAMAAPPLKAKLRQAIDQAGKTTPRVDIGRTRIMHDNTAAWCNINVQALAGDHEGLVLICFNEEPAEIAGPKKRASRNDSAKVAELERELEATQAELQTAIFNQEASTQEQKAINEEALSVNEEFQSTNEELLTSKEELQSLNEELTALNNQLEETLERQRRTSDDLQNVLFSTDVGTLFLDMDLKIRFYTPAMKSLFNIIPGDIGRSIADLKPISDDIDLPMDARLVLADETTIEREICGPNEAWFLRRIFPYRAHDDSVEGVVVTFADITDRKLAGKAVEAARLESERANIAKSRFLAAASHDLRQPLQSLTLLKELLAQCVEGEKPQQLVTRLGQTLGAMSGMLNALLDINQIEAGVIEPGRVEFPISNILDKLREEFSYMAQAQSLSLHILPTSALVQSDPALLEQILRNLLGNAVKYTRNGKILIGCRRRGDQLRVEVWDTGIGIAENQLQAIFDEFHQVDNAARERSRGLGLGLSIVKQLAQLLGHEIDVRSILGKGSVFTVRIPMAGDSKGGPTETAGTSMIDTGLMPRSAKIVIVDDDPDVLELLDQLLVGDGHLVRTAPDAAAAIKLITKGAIRPDILLTDYNLPGDRNGLELLSEARLQLSFDLPGIVLTGDISSETLALIDKEDCIELSKPVKAEELRAAIEKVTPKGLFEAAISDIGPSEKVTAIAYIIEDDPAVRSSFREVLEADGHAVEDFASAEAFLDSYRQGTEGCLLVDANLPGINGIALVEKLRARGDHLPAILITGTSDIGLAVEAMKTGACDFIEKPVGRVELLASIARAIDQSHDIRLKDALHDKAAAHVATLTPRQYEVMELVLAGHPSKNIAADLGISQRTVENHRAAVMRKMEAKSLPELARNALAATQGNPETA